eukprot:m51a1_g3034 hypothetical protein (203) ;mRNA; r:911499-912220
MGITLLLAGLVLAACVSAQSDCPCISGPYIKYGDAIVIFSPNGFYVTAAGGISANRADAVVLRITPMSMWRAEPLLKGDSFLLLNNSRALQRSTVIGGQDDIKRDLTQYGSVRFALGLGPANTTQTAQISSSSSGSRTGCPLSYSETIGLTFGGLAQGGALTQQDPANSNRRYVTIQSWAGISVTIDWWLRDEILRFIPAHP